MKSKGEATPRGNGANATYQPCPECLKGYTIWDGPCDKCGECGREFSASGVMLQIAFCEGDIDGWQTLS